MELGNIVGWLGVLFGLFVAPPQLIKIIKMKHCNGVSKLTYIALVITLTFYLLHAIYIKSIVFIMAQSINLLTNSTILYFLLKEKKDGV